MSAATKNNISDWFNQGVKQGATHMIVVCDSFDYDDYPVFISPNENARKIVAEKYNGQNMQHMVEVYDLRIDKEEQLAQRRVCNY